MLRICNILSRRAEKCDEEMFRTNSSVINSSKTAGQIIRVLGAILWQNRRRKREARYISDMPQQELISSAGAAETDKKE